jgi:hypothetical protein
MVNVSPFPRGLEGIKEQYWTGVGKESACGCLWGLGEGPPSVLGVWFQGWVVGGRGWKQRPVRREVWGAYPSRVGTGHVTLSKPHSSGVSVSPRLPSKCYAKQADGAHSSQAVQAGVQSRWYWESLKRETPQPSANPGIRAAQLPGSTGQLLPILHFCLDQQERFLILTCLLWLPSQRDGNSNLSLDSSWLCHVL